jgi:hypothetical protein
LDTTFAYFNCHDRPADKSHIKKEMTNRNRKTYLPIVVVFIILNGLIIAGKTFLDSHGFDREFLMWANLFLFLISIGGFLLQRKGVASPNPQAFVRGVYASNLFKMFLTIIVVVVYVFLMRSKINKPALFTAMALYIVYTAVEVTALMKLARKKKDG